MIRYKFAFEDGSEMEFEADENGDASSEEYLESLPGWLALDRFCCDHCAVEPDSRRACPAALSIRPLIEAFGRRVSHENVLVTVLVNDVKMEAVTSLQNGVRSLGGLLLALSACPTMMKLRPMARFHLPFGDMDQTVFRAVGMYLTAQHLRQVKGLTPDWSLDGLKDVYGEVHRVNEKLADRIRAASQADATVNSLIILDSLGHIVELRIKKNLEKLVPLFAAYLEDGETPPAE